MPKQYSFVIILGPGRVYAYGTDTLRGIEFQFNDCLKAFPFGASPYLVVGVEDGTGY